jgi:hypothetical protein
LEDLYVSHRLELPLSRCARSLQVPKVSLVSNVALFWFSPSRAALQLAWGREMALVHLHSDTVAPVSNQFDQRVAELMFNGVAFALRIQLADSSFGPAPFFTYTCIHDALSTPSVIVSRLMTLLVASCRAKRNMSMKIVSK